MSNFPEHWTCDPGPIYSKTYHILGVMAINGHVIPAILKRGKVTQGCSVSPEMKRLIEALANGNEEEIKGLLLLPYYTNYLRS